MAEQQWEYCEIWLGGSKDIEKGGVLTSTMKLLRSLIHLSAIAIAFLVVLRFPASASAAPIYSENFSGTAGTHLEDHETHWVRNTGNPHIVLNGDNTAGVVGETHYWWNSTQSASQDIQLDFKVHTSAGRHYYGIMHRENGGAGSFTNEQVYIEIFSNHSGQIVNTDGIIKYSFPAGYFIEGQWYTWRSTYDNNDIVTTYLNNQQLAQWDSSRTAFATGSFGLNVMNGAIRNLTYASLDSDGDGIPDNKDVCPDTPTGQVVDASGCSIDQLCPCNGPWRSHGEYVSCVSQTSSDFVAAGLITPAERSAIASKAAQSSCGN